MFLHGKTGKPYYSIREKINYYKDVIAGRRDAPVATKRKAKGRLRTLERLNQRTFDEPTLIVTDDKHFGNGISKPRLCIVVGKDEKGRLIAANMKHKVTDSIVLDNYPDRQIDRSVRRIDRSDVYETKYIDDVRPLTKYDKVKIRENYKKRP